jgi:hypothetical protein
VTAARGGPGALPVLSLAACPLRLGTPYAATFLPQVALVTYDPEQTSAWDVRQAVHAQYRALFPEVAREQV